METQTAVQSVTVCNHPIVGCLVAMEKILGPNRQWRGLNARQFEFLDEVFAVIRQDIPNFPELESFMSLDYKEINSFLKAKGFDIRLDPFFSPDFGVASVLKLVMEWLVKGEVATVTTYYPRKVGSDQYPAVRMKSSGVVFYDAPLFAYPIVGVKTKTEDMVYLTMLEGAVGESTAQTIAKVLLETKELSSKRYLGAVFPMVDLDIQPDISWLCGMHTDGHDGIPGIISQAKQQTRFKMDELGATVESAVAMAVARSCVGPSYYVIDKPFLAVVHRPSLKQPIFVGYLTQDCWKRPAR